MIEIPLAPKILITRTDNLGDVILTLPVITAIKKALPDSQISFLIKKYTAEAVDNYPGISEIITINEYDTLSKMTNLFKEKRFDVSLNIYPRYNVALAGLFANIPIRIGTAYRWYSFLFNEKVKVHRKDGRRHESDYNLDLVRTFLNNKADVKTEISFPTNVKVFEDLKNKLQAKYNFSFDSPYIIIHPFSKGSAKKWNSDNFIKLISEFLNIHKGFTVFLTGDASEKEIINELTLKINSINVLNIAGEISIKELIELINMSRLFISNSTGPLHIAGALNKKTISFFPRSGSTISERWKPLGSNNFIFEPEADDPGSEFIEGIDPEKVLSKSLEMLKV